MKEETIKVMQIRFLVEQRAAGLCGLVNKSTDY